MSTCKIYSCELCPLTFDTGDLRTKHKYEDHSEIGSVTVDGVGHIPCLRTSEGLLKCPSSDCPSYQKLHRSTFVKHLLKHNMKPITTKRAAPSGADPSHCLKRAKVTTNNTEGKHHLSLPVALNIISFTLTELPVDLSNKEGKHHLFLHSTLYHLTYMCSARWLCLRPRRLVSSSSK